MQLSERQQQTVAAALTIMAALVIVATLLGMFWILALFVQTFSNVLLPFTLAGIAAMVFDPYYEWLRERLRLPTPFAVAALGFSIVIPIGVCAAFFGLVLVRGIVDFFQQLPVWWEQLLQQFETHWPEVKEFFTDNGLGQKVAEVLQSLGPRLAAGAEYFVTTSVQATTSIAGWASAMLSWAIAPVYFVFFLMMKRKDISRLEDYLPFLKEETRKDVVYLVHEFVNIIVTFFRGQIIIAFLQGVLLAIGFSIIGLRYGFVLGFLLGFLNVIPYLGSMLGLTITLPLAYFQDAGGPTTVVGVVVVLIIVQMIEGYVLTPKIMGDRTGLHPMAIIFAVFFWGTALGGILGMILAIPLTAFLVVLWRLAKKKYISELI